MGMAEERGEELSTGQVLSTLSAVALPMFLAAMDQTIVSAALPSIAADLGDVERSSWIVVTYLIATTIAAPVYGHLRDAYGSRPLLLIALSMFISASVLCALAPSMTTLAAARLLQGLGGGGLMTLSQARIGEAIPPPARARYQGYLAAIMVTSSMIGPLAGGMLAHQFGWRSIFLVNVPLGLLAVYQALRIPRSPTIARDGTFDYVGLGYFVAFITSLLLALEFGRRQASLFLLLSVLALLAGIMLLRHEKGRPHPLIPVDLLARPAIRRADLLAACHGAAIVSLATTLPLCIHIFSSRSASETGVLLLPLMIGIGLGSTTTGRLVSRTGRTAIFPSVGLMVATVLLGALAIAVGGLGRASFSVLLFGIGLSMGTVMGVVQITVQTDAGRARLGAAAASVQLSRSLGAAVGTALVGAVLFQSLSAASPEARQLLPVLFERGLSAIPAADRAGVHAAAASAFRLAFLTIALVTAMGSVLAWRIPTRTLLASTPR
jgi:MFS family permease